MLNIKLIVPAVVLFVGFPLGALAQQSSPAELLKEAKEQVQKGDFDQGLKSYDDAIRRLATDQKDAQLERTARLERGLLLISLGQHAGAKEDFEKFEATFPGEDSESRYFRALGRTNAILCQSQLGGSPEEFQAAYRKVIESTRTLVADKTVSTNVRVAGAKLLGIQLFLLADACFGGSDLNTAFEATTASLRILPKEEGLWRAKALRLRGRVLAPTAAGTEGLKDLHEAATQFRANGHVTELPETLRHIVMFERDPAARGRAMQELKSLPVKRGTFPDANRLLWLAELEQLVEGNPEGTRHWLKEYEDRGYPAKFPSLEVSYVILAARMVLEVDDREHFDQLLARLEQWDKAGRLTGPDRVALIELRLQRAFDQEDSRAALEEGRRLETAIFVRDANSSIFPITFPLYHHAMILANLSRAMIVAGRWDLALHYARRATTVLIDLGMDRQAARTKLVYADAWLKLSSQGDEDGPPEWKRTLDEIDPDLFGEVDRAAYHLLYAEGLTALGRFEEARSHIEQLGPIRPPLKLQLLFMQSQLDLHDQKIEAAQRTFKELTAEAAGRASWQGPLLELEARLAANRGDLKSAIELFRRAARLADQITSVNPTLVYQAAVRDARLATTDAAVEIALMSADKGGEAERDVLAALVLEAVVPPALPPRVPVNAELREILSSMATNRLLKPSEKDHEFLNTLGISAGRFNECRFDRFQRDLGDYLAQLPSQPVVPDGDRGAAMLTGIRMRCQQAKSQVRVYYLGLKVGLVLVFTDSAPVAYYRLGKGDLKSVRRDAMVWRDALAKGTDRQKGFRDAGVRLALALLPDGNLKLPMAVEVMPHGPIWNFPLETLIVRDAEPPTYLDDVTRITYLTPLFVSRLTGQPAAAGHPIGSKPVGLFFFGPDLPDKTKEAFWQVAVEEGKGNTHLLGGKSSQILFRLAERTDDEREKGLVGSATPTWAAARKAMTASGANEVERREFERSVFADDVRSAKWLHFNAHGVQEFDKEWEPQVGVFLYPGPPSDGDKSGRVKVDYQWDGLLTPREIETLELHADVVFLHGCSTTAGFIYFSSGPLNLVSAFRTAGAEFVIASHWPVSSDRRISEQVGQFYGRVVVPNTSIAQALRELRKSLRQQNLPARDWGVFSVYR